MAKITTEEVNAFLNGNDPMERIITIECGYDESKVQIIYVNEKGEKRIKTDDFYPFIWCKNSAATRLFEGKRGTIMKKMREYGISVKVLSTESEDGNLSERLQSGYKYQFYATRPMPYATFQKFFSEGGVPINEKQKVGDDSKVSSKEFIGVTPVEQYMIRSKRRLFKGYSSYNDLHRLTFDLETQGLNPKIHRIEQIGIHTNRGFDRIISVVGNTKEELDNSERGAIEEMLRTLAMLKPDTVCGHNSENFDFDFLIVRCDELGTPLSELSLKYFRKPIYKKSKETVLKLGGEVEYFKPTIMWGHIILDSLHAARRAQAIDSDMKSSNLKYVTKYLDLKKENRVYVQGDKITKTWNDTEEHYAFNDENGDWYEITDDNPLKDGYEVKSGRYIVERYLLDDLWETDKVEERLNESNFLVGKMLPTTFSRTCTMGTAGIWKLIMLAWCYEHNLAIPSLGKNRRFVGGLSRLLSTGFVSNIVKLDFNSLYPSIILTWNIKNETDATGVLNTMLNYVLSEREKYKELKSDAGKKADELKEYLDSHKELPKSEKRKIKEKIQYWKAEKKANDKKQLPLKILGNSYFGSAGAAHIFPWGDNMAAEQTTCTGRMMLRLMISHFKSIGYTPIVGDSFTSDTPLFIKYEDSGLIDIKPISELIGDTEIDELGREYDTSEKPYFVLCRSGWMKPQYIYRHKTDKPLYKVSEGSMSVTVTEDHSLFNEQGEKIKPSEINENTKLEYYKGTIDTAKQPNGKNMAKLSAKMLVRESIDRVPIMILNSDEETITEFLMELDKWGWKENDGSKTCRAGIQFLKKTLI